MHFLTTLLFMTAAIAAALLAGAGILHLVPKLGQGGRDLSAALCRAPGLDWMITYFTVAPLLVGPILAGWPGLIGAIAGQIACVLIWTFLHELAHPAAVRGPRIIKVLNRIIGPWRNYTAVWLTAIVTPCFWLVRMAEVFIYPFIARLTGFPQYKGRDWVAVSRHKFSGLVGHDLIWCLYCDWMTGIWSLGSEMLRNVESFWCPIRFASDKKCDNCTTDFPDISNGWIPADGTMAQVTEKLTEMHSTPPRAWFGHPVRLTIKGKQPKDLSGLNS